MKFKVVNHTLAAVQANVPTGPRVSLTSLIRACFHDADQTSAAAAHHTLSMRRCPLLLYTSIWHPHSSPHTHTHTLPSLLHNSLLQSATFSFHSGHIRDEITHLAPGPVFIMYEWFYPRDAWCPFFFAREAERCPFLKKIHFFLLAPD